MEKSLFILYLLEANTFASEKWLYTHFNSLINNLFDVKIISGNPSKDRGCDLINFCRKNYKDYKDIYLITLTTDIHNKYIDWSNIKKFISSIIVFPIDSISVSIKFKDTIKNIADFIWCPHIQMINYFERFNKPIIYMPYASYFPINVKNFSNRENSLFFQGTAHGVRRSFLLGIKKKSEIKLTIQGKGWDNKESSLKKSFRYFLSKPINYYPTLIKNTVHNKFLSTSIIDYPLRILKEQKYKNEKIDNILPSDSKINIDNFKFTLGLNYLFSNTKFTSYRLRDFESAAYGTCHITNCDKNLEKVFEPNKSMVFYRDEKDLIEIVDYYMRTKEGQEKAQEIAINARKISEKNTWDNRLNSLLEFIELNKKET